MSQKVYFFEPYALAVPHFETALELIYNHAKRGDVVTVFSCDGELGACESNFQHDLTTCWKCKSRRHNGIQSLDLSSGVQIENFYALTAEEQNFLRDFRLKFDTIESLKNYRFEGVDIGMGVASSYISYKRNPSPVINSDDVVLLRLLKASLKVYFSFKRILTESRPDIVYVFNGRFSNIRPVIRLCQELGIEFRVHERGSNRFKYQISTDHLPHDFVAFQRLAEAFWKEGYVDIREAQARKFFEDRRMGKEQAWRSFTASQASGKLPAVWDERKRNIVIFNSSEDEFAAIGDTLKRRVFDSQVEGVSFITKQLETIDNVAVYLRIHPNLTGISNKSVEDLYRIKRSNFFVIPPDSDISTYELIDRADVVVTFGSTIGIEATYWGKPSLLLGDSFYRDLGATYNPSTAEEVVNLLLHESSPKEKVGALKYGAYVSNYGIDYRLYRPEGLFQGTLMGKKVRPSGWITKVLRRRPLRSIINSISNWHAERP